MFEIIAVVMLWEISIILAAISGFFVAKKYVGKPKKMPCAENLTEEQKREREQERIENENFDSYIGRVQAGHKDYR
jgi:hypothetical protein